MHKEKSDFDEIKGPTLVLAGINFVVYLFTSIIGGSFLSIGNLPLYFLGFSINTFLFNGFFWTPVTSIFTHSGIAHIGGNLLGLFIYGFKLEEEGYNSKQIYFAYFVTGILAGVISAFFPFYSFNTFFVGASGSVFGILGVNYGILKRINHPDAKKVMYFAIILFFMSFGPQTNIFAHLLGLIFGAIIGKSEFFANMNTDKSLV